MNTDYKEKMHIQVEQRLHDLVTQHTIRPLRELFTGLNYEYANSALPLSDERSLRLVRERPLIIATGGDDNRFEIIYTRLHSTLSLTSERTLITKLLRDHPYALFVFSNDEQSRWHFVNVKDGEKETKRPLLRRITVGPEERLRTAIERISMLDLAALNPELSGLSPLSIQNAHDTAFDVEAVTRAFYREYRVVFNILQKDLLSQTGDKIWAHDYALQLLNRCMFLYFIQRKHWLGDDAEFLELFWETYNKTQHEPDRFVSGWLNTLFFEAFNDKYNQTYNIFPPVIHTILMMAPYLNGGLFTKNELDRKEDFLVSDARFGQMFTLLQSYNFTISEDSPLDQEVAVDPEMIGTVYESLVNVSEEIDERGDAGIFYTPRTEIDLMCRLTLVDYLTNHIGEQQKGLLYEVVFAIEQEDKEQADKHVLNAALWNRIYDYLHNVRVVDPACGSGAFLVGMLAVLDDLMARAIASLGREDSYNPYNAYERKKRIIGRCLYGVDVMDWATHIAELRLWLTLIVDAEYTREELHARNEPLLPYFTFNVRCGDSLVQEIEGIKLGVKQRQHLSPDLRRRVNTLKQQKLDFYNNRPSRELSTKDHVTHEERRLFDDLLAERVRAKEEEQKAQVRRIAGMLAQPVQKQLDATDHALPPPSSELLERRQHLAVLEDELTRLRQARSAFQNSKHVPFVWDIAFVEIFADADERFDIVVGNPPYLRQENIHTPHAQDRTKEDNKAYKEKLARAMYELFPRFFGYVEGRPRVMHPINQKSDLYIYFYLLGLSLLNKKGSFCFITSNSWLDVGYGADLQEFLLKHCHIKLILDNEAKRSFANASVNTIISLFSFPDESSTSGLRKTARFMMSRVPFEELLVSSIFTEVEAATERQTNESYRVFPISQQKLLDDGIAAPEADAEDEEEQVVVEVKAQKGKSLREAENIFAPPIVKYSGNKWGGKYLRAPDIYWTIMEKGKDKLVRLDDIAKVRRGITTGADEFFFLDKTKTREWRIEERFLVPIVKSPRECKSVLINPRSLKSVLFVCNQDKEQLKGTAALEYIQWGESQGFHKRPSCASRSQWWSLSVATANSIFVKEANDTSAVFYNPQKYAVNCRLYYAELSPTVIAYLNSIVGTMLFELYNRVGLGEGARSLMVSDYKQVPVLVQEQRNVEPALQRLYELPARKLLGVESAEQAWLEVDTLIFDALHLSLGERDAVYEAVTNLVKARLNKAKSISAANATRKRVEKVEKLIGIWIGLPDFDEAESYNA